MDGNLNQKPAAAAPLGRRHPLAQQLLLRTHSASLTCIDAQAREGMGPLILQGGPAPAPSLDLIIHGRGQDLKPQHRQHLALVTCSDLPPHTPSDIKT